MFIRRLPLTCQILASDGSNTCVCRLEHLPLSRQRLAAVKQGEGGRHKRLSSLLPDRCKPVHSRNIRPDRMQPLVFRKSNCLYRNQISLLLPRNTLWGCVLCYIFILFAHRQWQLSDKPRKRRKSRFFRVLFNREVILSRINTNRLSRSIPCERYLQAGFGGDISPPYCIYMPSVLHLYLQPKASI